MESKFLLIDLEETQQHLIVYIKEVNANKYSSRYIDGIYLYGGQKRYFLCQLEKRGEHIVGYIKKQDLQEIAAFHKEDVLTLKVRLDFYKHELLFDIAYSEQSLCWQWEEHGYCMISNQKTLTIVSMQSTALLNAMQIYGYYESENEYLGKIILNSPDVVRAESEVLLNNRCVREIEDRAYSLILRDRNNKQTIELNEYYIDHISQTMVFNICEQALRRCSVDIGVWNVYLVMHENGNSIETRVKSNQNDIYPNLIIGKEGQLFEVRAYTTQDHHLGMLISAGEPLGMINEVILKDHTITISGEIELLTYHNAIQIESIKLKTATGCELAVIEEYTQQLIDTVNQFTLTIDINQLIKGSHHIEGDYYIVLNTKFNEVYYEYKLQYNKDQLIKEDSIFYPSITIESEHYPLVVTPMYRKSYLMLHIDNQFSINFKKAKLRGNVFELICEHNLDINLDDVLSTISLESEASGKIILLENQTFTTNEIKYNIPVHLLQGMNIGSMYKLNIKLASNNFEINKDVSLVDDTFLESKRQVFTNMKLLLNDGTLLLGYKNKNRFVLRKESVLTNGKVAKVKYKVAQKLAKVTAPLIKEQVWLVGENLGQIAQDNGFAFFEHCIRANKKEKIFYVSEKNNKNMDHLIPYRKHVLRYDSFKHMYYYHLARFLVVSHGIRDVMPRLLHSQIRNNQKEVIYLQHGIIAMKKVFFNKDSYNGRIKRFIVTSQREKQILVEQMNFRPEQVCITGLARFDKLEDCSQKSGTKTILIMPTWREWLIDSEDQFVASNFYKKYIGLLNNERLHKALVENNIIIKFYPHIEMQKKYNHLFSHLKSNIKIVKLGEEIVQDLIKECAMMITDYSSVALDVNYLRKPTLYYHFDLDEYMYYRGSFVDLQTELPGEHFKEEAELVEQILVYIGNNFKYNERYDVQSNKFYDYNDQNNSERIYQEIKTV